MSEFIIIRADGKLAETNGNWVEASNNAVYDNALSSRSGAERLLAMVIVANPTAKIIIADCWQLEMDASRNSILAAMTMGE